MKPFQWKHLLLWSVIAFLASPVQSQESQDPKLVEAARREGEIVWYTSMSLDQSKELMDLFHKKYPFLKPSILRTGGSTLLNRVLTEARAGKHLWDVLQAAGDKFGPLMEKNLLAPYFSSQRNTHPEDLKDAKGYWTSVYVNPIVVGYNTQLVKREHVPRIYSDLLDPRWKGRKISIDDDYYTFLQGLILAWGKEKAVKFLKKLGGQDPVVMGGTTARIQLTIAGEFPLVIAYANILQNFASKRAPIDWVPLEPAVVSVNSVMLGANASHPNAAKLFIDFVLSKEGQEKLWDFQRIPSRGDVKPKPSRLFRGYRRFVVHPGKFKNFNETIKLYTQIFKTR